jgi:hypothetical protein
MSDLRTRIIQALEKSGVDIPYYHQCAIADVLIRELPELRLIGQVFAPGHTITVTNVPPPKTLRDPDMIAADAEWQANHPEEAQ